MRKDRGNIILTAIFVAVFLFFLSVALLWTNRQDIALSLAMEHKMKGEAAARSGAMTVYASLRTTGRTPSAMQAELDSGASWKAELIELDPTDRRGTKLLVRCRGTSGPVSSYITLHLLETDLFTAGQGGNGQMLAFFGRSKNEIGLTTDTSKATENAARPGEFLPSVKVLYGDFELKDVDMKLDGGVEHVASSQGPIFASSRLATSSSPLAVTAYLPVFDPLGGALQAYGPLVIAAPKPTAETGLSMLQLEGDQFRWEPIAFPTAEPETPSVPPIGLHELTASGEEWNTIATRAVGEEGTTQVWKDPDPPTSSEAEVPAIGGSGGFTVDTSRLVDWGSTRSPANRRGYSLRGAIAAQGEAVYSHGWEYLYRHYSGRVAAAPVDRTLGNVVMRWPCVRKYDARSKSWSTAWSTLGDDGAVQSSVLPDPTILLAGDGDVLYTRTLESPSRLLTLQSGGRAAVGPPLQGGTLFVYQNQPYTISTRPGEPGFLNLLDNSVLGFKTLPALVPEVMGPVVSEIANEEIPTGLTALEVSSFDGQIAEPEMRTIRPRLNLSYAVASDAAVAVSGKELYTTLNLEVDKAEPTYKIFGSDSFGEKPPSRVLARYDGTRWHILPNGLMAQLVSGLPAPSGQPLCASYPGFPENISRYTVISVDTDPFEFQK